MNTSATGGFLQPQASPAPLDDSALVDFLQSMVAGITGLSGSVIFPRWQPEPPNMPAFGTNWAAIGITNRKPDTFASVQHVSSPTPYDIVKRQEELTLLVTFYGPKAETNCGIFRDGLQLPQNREVMNQYGLAVIETGDPVTAPELVKDRWLYRVDIQFRVRHQIVRNYAIEDLASAQITINNELYTETINVP